MLWQPQLSSTLPSGALRSSAVCSTLPYAAVRSSAVHCLLLRFAAQQGCWRLHVSNLMSSNRTFICVAHRTEMRQNIIITAAPMQHASAPMHARHPAAIGAHSMQQQQQQQLTLLTKVKHNAFCQCACQRCCPAGHHGCQLEPI